MRRILDGVYAGALWLACLAMVAIALLVMAQITGRVVDRVLVIAGASPLGFAVPSLSDFGGFLFVAAATLALPGTLRAGGHVRVTLLVGVVPRGLVRVMTGAMLLAALGLAGFAAWHTSALAGDSFVFNSVSFGRVRVPLWIPQSVMSLGFVLLMVAVLDELIALLRGKEPAFEHARRALDAEDN